jgi:hypothetical protein
MIALRSESAHQCIPVASLHASFAFVFVIEINTCVMEMCILCYVDLVLVEDFRLSPEPRRKPMAIVMKATPKCF